MNGSLYSLDYLRSYFFSYLFNNGNSDLSPRHISILISCIILAQFCLMTIGVKFGNKIGAKIITLIGVILINLSFLLMIFSTNYSLNFISMCIFGFGCGLSNLSVIKNCWEYYPNRLWLINGIIICGFRLSSSILSNIGDNLIINPEKRMSDYNGIYPKEVSDKFLNYIIFIEILFIILSIIAVCLTFNYHEEDEDEELNMEPILTNNDLSALCRNFSSNINSYLSFFCFCGPCI